MKRLQTNAEKAEEQAKKEELLQAPNVKQSKVVKQADLVREDGDYMRRQPRIDFSKLSYNFEQFD